MYTVHQAKTNLSKLLEEAESGKEVVIARGKTPVAKLVAIGTTKRKRTPGRYRHLIKIHPSFYEPMTRDELKEWGIE
ncbi:MAG TPA: type II toxin-antitoxin system prevent-host-death family antitoxin [Terriglobales bacterium]|jgi:prevent-host-death family protein|nr:type II toxin-antitoxin system prevent-host-death family antitoxin [Terriglobales bacterium]